MGQLGYQAMEVGERDLAGGLADLVDRARNAGVVLLGGNLEARDGSHPFAATRVVDLGDGRVGVLGVSVIPPEAGGEVHSEDPLPVVRAALQALRRERVDAVVALLHMPSGQADALVKALPGIDLVVQAHEGRSGLVAMQPPTYGGGQRGQLLARIHVDLEGSGPVHDGSGTGDARSELRVLDDQYRFYQARVTQAVTDAAREQLATQMAALMARREETVRAASKAPSSGRLATNEPLMLDERVKSEPKMAEAVAAEIARDGHTPGH